MTLKEAIEYLEKVPLGGLPGQQLTYSTAQHIVIEAARRIKHARESGHRVRVNLLPGETKPS